MAATTQTDVTDTQADWESGTLTDVEADGGALRLARQPVVYRYDFLSTADIGHSPDSVGTSSVVDGPGSGGKVLSCSGEIWLYIDVLVPYDPAKLYEVSGRVRQTDDGTTENSVYIGLEGVASDGTSLIDSQGGTGHGSQHYVAAQNWSLYVAEDWKTFRGYVTGVGGFHYKANDPTDPSGMYSSDIAYIRPMAIINHNNGDGTAEIDYLQIREVDPVEVVNKALGALVVPCRRETSIRPASVTTDGDRTTTNYTEIEGVDGPEFVVVDLGEPKTVNQLGIWHYNSDNRTYNETRTQVSTGEVILHKTPTPLLDYSTWVVGSTGSQPGFPMNGNTAENAIVEQADPFGMLAPIWQADTDGSGSSDGGWRATFTGDSTKAYRLSVFMRKTTNLEDGSLYLGCDPASTNNLSGSQNTNPYFWNGDLPNEDEWFLVVGMIHPHDYTGGDSGVSGVYRMSGSKLADTVTEYKWIQGATEQTHRAFMYYADLADTRADFVYPRVDEITGTEPPISDMLEGLVWRTVFDSADHSTYAETTKGKWHGLETQYVRYIRDWLNGNTVNAGNHWLEIEAYGEPEKALQGSRSRHTTQEGAGRVTTTNISWLTRNGVMCANGSYVRVPYTAAANIETALTIEAWVCWMGQDSVGNEGTVLTNVASYYFQVKDDGTLAAYTYWNDGGVKAGSSYTISTGRLTPGVWEHIAYTEDASGLRRLYIGGALDTSEQMEASIFPAAEQILETGIGQQFSSQSRDFFGGISEVRLWDYDRSESELQASMYERLTGSEAGLRGYWPMDDGSGAVAIDLTGNSNANVVSPRWLSSAVETNVSLDGGITWAGWKTPSNGGAIPDIPADADGRDVVVDCRQSLDATYSEVSPLVEEITITAEGNRALVKVWDGAQWITANPKVWDGTAQVASDPRVFTNGRWL